MTAFILYLAAVVADGDYLNDWLTHIPTMFHPFVLAFGYLVAIILGS